MYPPRVASSIENAISYSFSRNSANGISGSSRTGQEYGLLSGLEPAPFGALRWQRVEKAGILSPGGRFEASGTDVSTFATGATVLTTAENVRSFSPDDRFVVDESNTIWDLEKGVKFASLPVRAGRFVAIAPGGESAIVVSDDNKAANVWSTGTRRRLRILRVPPAEGGMESAISNVVFSSDGEIALVLGEDGTTDVWATDGWKLMAVLRGHQGRVIDADVSSSGAFVVTAGADGTARIWEAKTGAKVATLEPGGGAVEDAKFAPDGRSVLVASADRTVRVYSCDACHSVEGLTRLAKSRATRRLTANERREFLHER
jgi:hypothetical protein